MTWKVDFTSALYLGLKHASYELKPWQTLTLGKPAALETPPGAAALADSLAQLQGLEAGTLGTSTLHLFWDLFGLLADMRADFFVDEGAYPIARWGAVHATARGASVKTFNHYNPDALSAAIHRSRRRPIVISDGFCPRCGRLAPLPAYLNLVRARDGILIIDDTQALGILGANFTMSPPYGVGGGGTIRAHGINGSDLVAVSSLAKGFGAPLACLVGSHPFVERFEAASATAVHCSPPSVAAFHAGQRAVRINGKIGDRLRRRLAENVSCFRGRLQCAGLVCTRGWFPVQTLRLRDPSRVRALYRALTQSNIKTVLQRSRNHRAPTLSFIITIDHSAEDIERTQEALIRELFPRKVRALE